MKRILETARLLRRRHRQDRESRGAVLAAGCRRQGRYRRGSRAHRRRRSRALDRIPARRRAAQAGAHLRPEFALRKAKRALAARGLAEAVTWSFISKPQAELFGGGAPALALANPIAADLSDMRPSLIPGLVTAAQKNADRGFPDVGAVRGRADFQGRQAGGSVHRCLGRAARLVEGRRRRPSLANGGSARAPTCSTPRPMRWPRSRPPARRCRRCRSCPADRPGFIPAAAAPSRSGRRTSSAISANCIRARSRRSTPRARSPPSR